MKTRHFLISATLGLGLTIVMAMMWLIGAQSAIAGDDLTSNFQIPILAPSIDILSVCKAVFPPCDYTSIQAAVNASEPGYTIYVYPGTYTESVNLSSMGTIGDINFITVDNSGAPTPGTVTIDPGGAGGPGAGPAIYNDVVPFNGDVTIDGFIVKSPDSDGILVNVNSDVIIANVTAVGVGDGVGDITGDDGMDITSQTGNITVSNSIANESIGVAGDGFRLYATVGNVTIYSSTAISNSEEGYEVNVGGNVYLWRSIAKFNSDDGFSLEADGFVSVYSSTANWNLDEGFDVDTPGDILFVESTADHNDDDGYDLEWGGNVTIYTSTANLNGDDGFDIDVNGNVIIFDSSADNNLSTYDGDGFDIYVGGDVIVVRSSANGNGQEGIDTDRADGNVTYRQCSAEGNGGEGIDIDYVAGNVSVDTCTGSNNESNGFEIGWDQITGTVMVNNLIAHGNSLTGIQIWATGNITITNSMADNNGSAGDYYDGFDLETTEGNVTIINSSAINNIGPADNNGFEIGPVGGNVVVRNVNATGNSDDGFDIWDITGTVSVNSVIASGNARNGFWLDGFAAGESVNNNIICNNGNGLWLNFTANSDAEGNWWGDVTGPTHLSNPTGVGDTVKDGFNGAFGAVDFDPWIDTLTADTSVDPVNLGQPTVISFQFSDIFGTQYLGLGPGDFNATPPFTITTDNGTLTSLSGSGTTVIEFINIPNGTLLLTLIPETIGTAQVTLFGPCNLEESISVQVESEQNYAIFLPLIVKNAYETK